MFTGKVAVVTGGCRGIGAAITRCLAESGAHVAAGYNRGLEAAEALAADLRAEGRSISLHQGNVADPEACARVVQEVLDQQGRIVIPQDMREHASLEDRVVLVGLGDYVEVWDLARWDSADEAALAAVAEDAEA